MRAPRLPPSSAPPVATSASESSSAPRQGAGDPAGGTGSTGDASVAGFSARTHGWGRPDHTDEARWVDSFEGRYLTDSSVLAAVLPPFLEPAERPLVHVSVATWAGDDGMPQGRAHLSVAARHGHTEAEYPLLVCHTDDARLIEAREVLGHPAKLAEITSRISGKRIDNAVIRHNRPVLRLIGVVEAPADADSGVRREFTVRITRDAADPSRLEADPVLCLVEHDVEERRAVKIGGVVRLGRAPRDPVADLALRSVDRLRLAQQRRVTRVSPITTVDASAFEPFLHQRFDDLHVDPVPRQKPRPGRSSIQPPINQSPTNHAGPSGSTP